MPTLFHLTVEVTSDDLSQALITLKNYPLVSVTPAPEGVSSPQPKPLSTESIYPPRRKPKKPRKVRTKGFKIQPNAKLTVGKKNPRPGSQYENLVLLLMNLEDQYGTGLVTRQQLEERMHFEEFPDWMRQGGILDCVKQHYLSAEVIV